MEELLFDAAKPKLEDWFNKIVDNIALSYKTTVMKEREHFMHYLETTYNNFCKIRPVGFQETLEFNNIYIPLTLQFDNEKNEEWVVDSFPKELVLKHKHLLIVDNAGMGKSTISKRMFMKAYEDGSCGIPIFVELRHLSEKHNILKEILHNIERLSAKFNEKLLTILLEKGNFVIFLDGYDEISLSEKSAVTKSLQDFIKKLPDNIFILTSRQDDALSGFQSFSLYSIMPLKEKDSFKLLSNLDNNGQKSQHLINTLKQNKNDGVKEFLVNPLLVTLLYTAFDSEPIIPTKKHLFYDKVFNAFFQQHDFSKGDFWTHDKKSKLEKDDFERVLRFLGFASVWNHKVEFTRIDIIRLIEKAKEQCHLTFSASDFLDDLILSVPLFLKEGTQYKWAHKSLSEYFAVEYIAIDTLDEEKKYVKEIYERESNSDYNLFDLYYHIKPSGFNQFLLLPCLKDIKDELMSHDDDIERIIFCSKQIGQIFIIQPKTNTEINIEENPEINYFTYRMKDLLPQYECKSILKPSKKWWTLLNILIDKQSVIKSYSRPSKMIINDVPHLKSYLSKNNKLKIDFTNILQIDLEVIKEINGLLWPGWKYLITKKDCDKKIKEIRKEIEDKENFSSWEI